MFCYLAALRNTTVADVVIIYGTAPLVVAALAPVLLGRAHRLGRDIASDPGRSRRCARGTATLDR
jgi:drug/metabolite transporter (DMT)-like permease